MSDTVYIGCGAGFAGDRFDAGLPVIETLAGRDGPRYLIYETLAERTLAIAQKQRLADPAAGFSPYLERYMQHALAPALENGVKIISNFGAANPKAGAEKIRQIAVDQGLRVPQIAYISGDDLTVTVPVDEFVNWPTMEGVDLREQSIISANVYLGARAISDALDDGAEIVVVGRCGDPALVVGPLMHEFGWQDDDLEGLAVGTMAGHLLECGAQVTGGYFADPGFKDVPDLANVGFPVAEIGRDGRVLISKAENTGGLVSEQTVKEQLLYEIHDPGAYLTADVTLDISNVEVSATGHDKVALSGARGKSRPDNLKATVCFEAGWLGEAEITYAGPNALARAEMAVDILAERNRALGLAEGPRFDILGSVSVHDGDSGALHARGGFPPDGDYRVRAAANFDDPLKAKHFTDEVLSLYCSGPAGGSGVRQAVTGRLGTASVFVPRDRIHSTHTMLEG